MLDRPYQGSDGKPDNFTQNYRMHLNTIEQTERIMSEVIAPRARSIRDEGDRLIVWMCVGFLAQKAKPLADRERQVAHVRLMTHLLQNCDSYESDFWASIIKWQLARYKHQCAKLLEDYKATSKNNRFDAENSTRLANVLEKAVERVYALQEPEKPTVADAFVIRNIYDDPDLKAHISSSFSPEQQLKLSKVVDIQLLQQPAFPPECWSLLKGT